MSGVRRALAAWLPPAVVQAGRRLMPPPPMFSGVYGTRAEVDDENPWHSDARVAFAEAELTDLLSASSGPLPLSDSLLVPCLLINLLSSGGRRCRVLDVGGGTGAAYFRLRASLAHQPAVTWMVVDNPRLLCVGQRYRRDDDHISFHESIPEAAPVDLILINTALQYVDDYELLIAGLAARRARFMVLTRLIAGDIPTHFSRQNNIQGGTTPCLFVNRRELIDVFNRTGFELVHESLAGEDWFAPHHYERVPPAHQVDHTLNLVFEHRAAASGR